MLSLDMLQSTLARSVLGRAQFGLSPLLEPGHANPLQRLRVYRNNTRLSLTATLLSVFPVTARLVDERFFRYAADAYIREFPPRQPRLSRYGADFPAFLRSFEGLGELPFVAETARLEWAIAEALDAPALLARAITELERGGAVTPYLTLQPSLRLIVSHWPVMTIWQAHQDGAVVDAIRRWQKNPQRIALWRQGDSIRFALLSAAQFSFRHALNAGSGLDRAVTRAFSHDPMFDLATALLGLFGDGLVTAVRFCDQHPISKDEDHEHDL